MLKNEHVKCTRLRNKIIKWEVTQNDMKCRCRQCCREDYHCSSVLQNFLISDLALLSVLILRLGSVIDVTERNCYFVVEDCLALNCNLRSLLVFPNKRNAQ